MSLLEEEAIMPAYLKPRISEFFVYSGIVQTQYVIAAGTSLDLNQCTGNGVFQIPPGDHAESCFSTDPEVELQDGNRIQLECQETPGVVYIVTFDDLQPGSITCPHPDSETPFIFQYTSSHPFPEYCTVISSIHLDGCWEGSDECTTVDYPNCVER
jgi:hypothetical protein